MDSASKRIMSEFRALAKDRAGPISSIRFIDDADIFTWRMQLKHFDDECEGGRQLNNDLERLGALCNQDYIEFEIKFPEDYPNQPFFCRLISPRCVMYTGHVTAGGSICLEMLTLSNTPGSWRPEMTVSGVMMAVLNNLVNAEVGHVQTLTGPGGRSGPLRVDFSTIGRRVSTYSAQEAQSAFSRMMHNHQRSGWNSGVDAAVMARLLQAPDAQDAAPAAPGKTGAAAAAAAPSTSGAVAAASHELPRGMKRKAQQTGVDQVVDMLGVSREMAALLLELRCDSVDDAVAFYLDNPDATVESLRQLPKQASASTSSGACNITAVVDLCCSDDDDADEMAMDEGSDDEDFDAECEEEEVDTQVDVLVDATGLEVKQAAELLRKFGGDAAEALAQWEVNEVFLREMLGVIPSATEDQCQRRVTQLTEGCANVEEKLTDAQTQLLHAQSNTLLQGERRESELAALASRVTDLTVGLSISQRCLAQAKVALQEARASRSVSVVAGDVFQYRIHNFKDLQISRVAGVKKRPVYTRHGQKTAYLYSIKAAETFRSPAEEYHFKFAESQLLRSMKEDARGVAGVANLKVTRVEVNENPDVELRYQKERKRFFDAGKPVTEELVFHGTRSAAIMDQICAEGFEIGGHGVERRNGAAYGEGVYVAKNANISLGYAHGTRQLLLCKCAVGFSVVNGAYMQGTDSDCNDIPGFALVLKSKAQVLPKYIVYVE